MKITERSRPLFDTLGVKEDKQSRLSNANFQNFFSSAQTSVQRQELGDWLKTIGELGDQLEKSCSWSALMAYKDTVRKFLEMAIRGGFSNLEKTGRDRRGRTRLYKIISQIDQLFAELTEEVLREEKDHLAILGKIGDLRGLLMNLYG